MSTQFCLLIPAKIISIDKHFSNTLKERIKEYTSKQNSDLGLAKYRLYTLKEFQQRADVHLDLGEDKLERYWVIDWGDYFPTLSFLDTLLQWLTEVYPYGEVGYLKYWLDNKRRFPPITIASIADKIKSIEQLPLDIIWLLPLRS